MALSAAAALQVTGDPAWQAVNVVRWWLGRRLACNAIFTISVMGGFLR